MSDSAASQPAKPKPWGIWATSGFSILVLAVFVLMQALVATVAQGMEVGLQAEANIEVLDTGIETNGFWLAIATIAATPLCTALIFLLARLRKRLSVKEYLGLRKPTQRQVVMWSLVTIFTITIIDLLKLLADLPIVPEFARALLRTAHILPLLYFALVIAAPIFEEFFFRGFLFQGLRYSAVGSRGAVIIPALLWAVLHLQYAWHDIAGLVILGILFGIARLQTDSIFVPIVMHAINNFLSVIQGHWGA